MMISIRFPYFKIFHCISRSINQGKFLKLVSIILVIVFYKISQFRKEENKSKCQKTCHARHVKDNGKHESSLRDTCNHS